LVEGHQHPDQEPFQEAAEAPSDSDSAGVSDPENPGWRLRFSLDLFIYETFAIEVTTTLHLVGSKSQGYANYTMQMVANATGHDVVWNRTGRFLSELSEDV